MAAENTAFPDFAGLPPFDLEVGANAATRAIYWLAGQLQEEQAARKRLETLVLRAGQLQSDQVAQCGLQDDMISLRFDTLRHELAGRLAAQVRECVAVETRSVVEDGMAREALLLRERLESIVANVNLRLKASEARIEELFIGQGYPQSTQALPTPVDQNESKVQPSNPVVKVDSSTSSAHRSQSPTARRNSLGQASDTSTGSAAVAMSSKLRLLEEHVTRLGSEIDRVRRHLDAGVNHANAASPKASAHMAILPLDLSSPRVDSDDETTRGARPRFGSDSMQWFKQDVMDSVERRLAEFKLTDRPSPIRSPIGSFAVPSFAGPDDLRAELMSWLTEQRKVMEELVMKELASKGFTDARQRDREFSDASTAVVDARNSEDARAIILEQVAAATDELRNELNTWVEKLVADYYSRGGKDSSPKTTLVEIITTDASPNAAEPSTGGLRSSSSSDVSVVRSRQGSKGDVRSEMLGSLLSQQLGPVQEDDHSEYTSNMIRAFNEQLNDLRIVITQSRKELHDQLLTELRRVIRVDVDALVSQSLASASPSPAASGGGLGPLVIEVLGEVESEKPELQLFTAEVSKPSLAPAQVGPGGPDFSIDRQVNLIRNALLRDKPFLNAVHDGYERLLIGDSASVSNVTHPTTTSTNLAVVNQRLAALERAISGSTTPTERDGGVDETRGFIPLMRVEDELRRLKCRFEYLERIVPADVQQALEFFDPMADRDTPRTASSTVGNAVVLRHVTELQRQQMQSAEVTQTLAKDGLREVMNVSLSIRSMQRQLEMDADKIVDLRRDLTHLRSQTDLAFPELVNLIGNLLSKIESGEVGQDCLTTLRRVLASKVGDRENNDHPFVSQVVFKKALQTMQDEVNKWLAELRADILNGMRSKADNLQLAHLAEQLSRQEQQMPAIRKALLDINPEMCSADSAAFLRWQPPLRCVSCDAPVDASCFHKGPPQRAITGVLPSRAANGKDIRPVGAGMTRNLTLPALQAGKSGASQP